MNIIAKMLISELNQVSDRLEGMITVLDKGEMNEEEVKYNLSVLTAYIETTIKEATESIEKEEPFKPVAFFVAWDEFSKDSNT